MRQRLPEAWREGVDFRLACVEFVGTGGDRFNWGVAFNHPLSGRNVSSVEQFNAELKDQTAS